MFSLFTNTQSTIPCLSMLLPVAMLVQTTADSVGSKVRRRDQAPLSFNFLNTGSLPWAIRGSMMSQVAPSRPIT